MITTAITATTARGPRPLVNARVAPAWGVSTIAGQSMDRSEGVKGKRSGAGVSEAGLIGFQERLRQHRTFGKVWRSSDLGLRRADLSQHPGMTDEPTQGELRSAWDAFRGGRIQPGIAAARTVVADRPRHGEGWYVLGLCLERSGRYGEADRCFQRAARAPEAPQTAPFRVSLRRFRTLVEVATASLPSELRAVLDEVTVVLADHPDDEASSGPHEHELLGLFEGAPRSERQDAEATATISPRIHLFRRAHEHACGSMQDLAAEIRSTLIHELGHYLGYDEDELERLGWE
jgi:predicted Zn-dependent protease with MMP-like domain